MAYLHGAELGTADPADPAAPVRGCCLAFVLGVLLWVAVLAIVLIGVWW